MPDATIEGSISQVGYIHLTYHMQKVDGTLHGPYDIVITPKNEHGAVSFTLPQGISATIKLFETMGGGIVMEKTVTIPRSDRVKLADLLK
jgi:hypothetical protein